MGVIVAYGVHRIVTVFIGFSPSLFKNAAHSTLKKLGQGVNVSLM